MKCPGCGVLDRKSKVTDSRPYKHTVKRSRLCSLCGHRWITYEATEHEFTSDRNRNKYLPWSPGEEETAIMMHYRGASRIEIANALGRGRNSVKRKLDKLKENGEYLTVIQEGMKQA
ncbi:hypothetical protein V1503_24765 [Bacillus sp. SCS-151]|uniref:NrdR family transcriptional regulator n=1 Tax=Nanhaiella sioensis TaxID=3115293 RepID=UPI00397E1FAA